MLELVVLVVLDVELLVLVVLIVVLVVEVVVVLEDVLDVVAPPPPSSRIVIVNVSQLSDIFTPHQGTHSRALELAMSDVLDNKCPRRSSH